MRALLLSQCVQADFVAPLVEDAPLPSLVHVGHAEAERLCGPAGALAGFLADAHAIPERDLGIVHLCDQHDPVRDRAHLERFRPHCLVGTPGAEPIAGLPAWQRGRARVVRAGDLCDFGVGAGELEACLGELVPAGEAARIAVVGVWTDAKVSFLLYDLHARLGERVELATSSALVASRSRGAHFAALERLEVLLGVRVLHSPGALLDWLVPSRPRARPLGPVGSTPVAAPEGWSAEARAEREALLAELAPPGAALAPLGGGFSGAQVLLARPADPKARASVVKIGARDEIARERFGNERVARVLGDVVPALEAWRESHELGGMRLELAESEAAATPRTFQRIAAADAGDATTTLLCGALEQALDGALGRLYRTAERDVCDLLETYGFVDRLGRAPFAASVARKAAAVAADSGATSPEALLSAALHDGRFVAPETLWSRVMPGSVVVREVHAALVHGDLNLQNLLISAAPGATRPARLWIIDFARLGRLPALTDFAKIENDLCYILCAIEDDAALARAVRIQDARLGTPTLDALDLEHLAETPAERRLARLLGTLRGIAARIDPRGPAAMDEHRVALLRYAAHTLGFDEPSPRQRALALFACGRLGHWLTGVL